jgi:hypothetical protein
MYTKADTLSNILYSPRVDTLASRGIKQSRGRPDGVRRAAGAQEVAPRLRARRQPDSEERALRRFVAACADDDRSGRLRPLATVKQAAAVALPAAAPAFEGKGAGPSILNTRVRGAATKAT